MPPAESVAIVFAFPPCTDTAVSGAWKFKEKGLSAIIKALQLFERAVKISENAKAPYMIENPVSTISTYWRKPDHIIQPWMYGDLYTKKTCLWIGNNFKMPEVHYSEKPDGVKKNYMLSFSPTDDRRDLRAVTPMGFAEAVFESNN